MALEIEETTKRKKHPKAETLTATASTPVPVNHVLTGEITTTMLSLLGDHKLVKMLMDKDLRNFDTARELLEVFSLDEVPLIMSAINCNLLSEDLEPHPYLIAQYNHITESEVA